MAHGTMDPVVRPEWGEVDAPRARGRGLRGRLAYVSDAAFGRAGGNRRDPRVPRARPPLAYRSLAGAALLHCGAMTARTRPRRLSSRDLRTILGVTSALAAPFDLMTMLGEVVAAAKQVLAADRGSVWLHDRGHGRARARGRDGTQARARAVRRRPRRRLRARPADRSTCPIATPIRASTRASTAHPATGRAAC